MAFTPKTDWKAGDPLPASDVNRIEQGVADANAPVSYNDLLNKPTLLTIGTTATTAKAGNYAPAWGDVIGKPAVIAAGADEAAARTAIGAGTSNLAIGTTASTAAAGNHTHTATQVTATAVTGGTATNVQGILAELTARIVALETAGA